MINQSRAKFLLLSFLFLSLFSCQENNVSPEQGKLTFSFDSKSALESGRIAGDDTVKYLIVTVEDASGNKVYERKKIELYYFGGEYLSEPIEIKPGSHKLTEFFVADENNAIVYATPLENSKLAYLVDDPLPIEFSVVKDQTTKVTPQVVAIDEYNNAEDFGYTTFSFDVVETLSFQVAVFIYDETTKNFELTSSKLNVLNASGVEYFNKDIPDSTSRIVVKSNSASYQLTFSKAGYQSHTVVLTKEELSTYKENAVLKIILSSQSLTEGLIAYYPFNGNAKDLSGNNLNGIVHEASLTKDRKGNANSAYYFDGQNDYINVPHSELLNLSGDFTISLWTEISSTQTYQEGIHDILRKWNGDGAGYPFSISYLSADAPADRRGKLLYVQYDGQGCGNAAISYTPNAVATDSFVNIVFKKQGNTFSQYLNGALVAEFTDNTYCSTGNTADMTIGTRGNLVRFFKGKVDDIRIYGRALSTSEITTLYHE
jgi:hypothetical protein